MPTHQDRSVLACQVRVTSRAARGSFFQPLSGSTGVFQLTAAWPLAYPDAVERYVLVGRSTTRQLTRILEARAEARALQPAKIRTSVTQAAGSQRQPGPAIHISTRFVERQNLTIADGHETLLRPDDGFSRRLRCMSTPFASISLHYNFARQHSAHRLSHTRAPRITRPASLGGRGESWSWLRNGRCSQLDEGAASSLPLLSRALAHEPVMIDPEWLRWRLPQFVS